MPLAKAYAFTTPTLSERVSGIQKMIDEKLEELRLKKHGGVVYLRMVIYDSPKGYPDLEERLRKAYGIAGWHVVFAYWPEGTEIILR